MRVIYNPSTDPAFNLAAEEWLLQHTDRDIFMLWRNAPAIIVGRNQNTLAEINVDYVRDKNIPVVRRLTGGGAVFHDLGNLNFTFISLRNTAGGLDFRRFATPVIDALNSMGVPCEFTGRNDMVVHGKKISGNAQHVHRGRVLHHGTLLFSACVDDISAALRPGDAKYAGRSVKSVRSRVGNIADFLPVPMTIEQFAAALLRFVAGAASTESSSLSGEESESVNALADAKYRTWNWNFGHSPKYGFERATRTPGGVIDVHMDVRDGLVRDIRLFGDYFGVRDVGELEDILRGCRHERQALELRLADVQLDAFMQSVGVDAFLDCLF